MNSKYYDIYAQKLQKCGIPQSVCEKLLETYPQLKTASYATRTDSGLSYEGSLLETILTKLTVFAVKINDLYPEAIMADKMSLVKICLLQHISKCLRLTPSTDPWRIKNLGEAYTYTEGMPAIGTGLHSLSMAASAGVEFTPLEAEAMTIIDRSDDDLQSKYHCSLLSSVVKQANEMVYVQSRQLEKMHKDRE